MPDVTGLFDSFLESAASLAVLFIIVAWVSSKVVEFGQMSFNLHGKMLRRELKRCFGDENGDFTRYFYWHPMIEPLTQPSRIVDLWRRVRSLVTDAQGGCYPPGRLPGYIAPESFAAVVMNPFPWPTTREPLRRLLIANLQDPKQAATPEFEALVANLTLHSHLADPGETWGTLLARPEIITPLPFKPEFLGGPVDIHSRATSTPVPPAMPGGAVPPPPPNPPPSDPVARYVWMCRKNELLPHPLETRIVTLLRDADGDMDEFRTGLRRWYAEAMNRVTSRFKRTALICVFFIALALCAAFNLNAIGLFSALVSNPELRATGVQAARAMGSDPRDIGTLGQKLAFYQAYDRADCGPKLAQSRDCRERLLGRLWRWPDSGDKVVDKLLAAPAGPAPAATADPKQQQEAREAAKEIQADRLREICDASTNLCSAGLSALLVACDRAPKGPDNPLSPDCSRAWDAIWREGGFFWHSEAARQLGLSLLPPSKEPQPDLEPVVHAARDLANTETSKIKSYIQSLPDVDFFWFRDQWAWPAWSTIFGVIISALLAALGAPFWYDVLGKLSGRGSSARKAGQE
jgi:hypothetical protein